MHYIQKIEGFVVQKLEKKKTFDRYILWWCFSLQRSRCKSLLVFVHERMFETNIFGFPFSWTYNQTGRHNWKNSLGIFESIKKVRYKASEEFHAIVDDLKLFITTQWLHAEIRRYAFTHYLVMVKWLIKVKLKNRVTGSGDLMFLR